MDRISNAIRRRQMFIAMNRFQVIKGSEADFENVWLSRDSHLDKVPGFIEFHLLRGPEAEDHTLYASHTVWKDRATFDAWTKSEAFRAAHARAGGNKPLYLGHPQFEGFETLQALRAGKTATA
jgi:heme-degrading monooxygenase HmoA